MKEIQCQEPWFSKIKTGLKKVEGRKFSPKYAALHPGEILKFCCEQDSFLAQVVKVIKYSSLEEYLKVEGIENVLPGVNTFEEAVTIYQNYNSRESLADTSGFLAIHLQVLHD